MICFISFEVGNYTTKRVKWLKTPKNRLKSNLHILTPDKAAYLVNIRLKANISLLKQYESI